ncbi:ectonucleotide pyrophosphatase/phosphodiesterase family member 5-like isoform X4 [Rhodnius prolixus]
MWFLRLIFIFCLISINYFVQSSRLLVVSFDGFRYDYINRNITPNLHKLKSKSTSAKFMINVFPTQTFTNHFSLATGLYSEHHCVLASKIYLPEKNIVLKYGYELWHYNDSVVPIWTLNEKAGNPSGVMMWPGSDFEYANTKTTYVFKYNISVPWTDRVNIVMDWFTDKEKPAKLTMMYFEQPDKDSHAFGPDSPHTNSQIQNVDKMTKYILDQLKERNITDVNAVFLSDHGMEGVTVDRIIDLRPVVGNISEMYGTSPVLQVYPHKGKEDEVFKKLKLFALNNTHFQVYKRSEIPVNFHYKKCSRAPPIMVLAEPKYAFQDLYEGIKWYKTHYNDVTDNNTFGVHGYDPQTIDMHPYFIAHGPMFKKNFEADHLYTVDMYLLFAKILDLKPQFNDGNFNRVLQVFNPSSNKVAVIIGLALLVVGGIIIFAAIFMR